MWAHLSGRSRLHGIWVWVLLCGCAVLPGWHAAAGLGGHLMGPPSHALMPLMPLRPALSRGFPRRSCPCFPSCPLCLPRRRTTSYWRRWWRPAPCSSWFIGGTSEGEEPSLCGARIRLAPAAGEVLLRRCCLSVPALACPRPPPCFPFLCRLMLHAAALLSALPSAAAPSLLRPPLLSTPAEPPWSLLPAHGRRLRVFHYLWRICHVLTLRGHRL